MGSGVFFPINAIFYIMLVFILFFFKKHFKSVETKMYAWLIGTNLFGLLVEFLCTYASYKYFTYPLFSIIILKLYLVYIITWAVIFAVYIFTISHDRDYMLKIKSKTTPLVTALYWLVILIIYILPIELVTKNNFEIRYTTGASVNFVYAISTVIVIIMLYCMIINYKNLKSKKYLPLFVFLVLGTGTMYFQMMNPEFLLMTSMETFITVLMYFTIENPDMRMVDELLQNKKLVEDSFQERSTFLFKISQDVKEPVSNINKLIKLYKNEERMEEKEEILDIIENNSRYLTFMVNDVLNISSMDIQKLNIMEDSYKTFYFFEDIKRKIQTEENTLVEINYKINQIPNELMGDSIKLKQALIAIIKNAINNTAKGFVDIDINALVRYDVCRLIITIEDSSDGMSINKINDILSNNNEISEKDLGKLKDLDVGFEMAVRIIKILGGMVDIQSEDKKGTKITLIINQRIPKQDNTLEEEVKSYNKASGNKKRILLVSDKQVFQKKIELLINKDEKEIVPVLFASECIDRLKRGEKYYLIIIDDSMKDKRSLEVLQELQKIPKFNTKVIVILDKMTSCIKEHYLDDGFTDYLLKDNLKAEIERINSKYLS